jgi:hypothetical protein
MPPRYCGRGWFRNFSEILFHTMPHDLILLQGVTHFALALALSRKPEYHLFRGNWFVRSARIESFEPLLLSNSNYPEYQRLGGVIPGSKYSPAVTRFVRPHKGAQAVSAPGPERSASEVLLGPEPEKAIAEMSPSKAAEYLVHCLHLGPVEYAAAMERVARAHPADRFWLELCEVLEKAKLRPDSLSASVREWREKFEAENRKGNAT